MDEQKPKPIIFAGNLEELTIHTGHKEWVTTECSFYSSPVKDLQQLNDFTEDDLSRKGYDALIHAKVVPFSNPGFRFFYTGLPVRKK